MRELDECTAEVFRRGEQRIKERRRKRNRVLAVCIPVCLIAAVWPAVIFPSMSPEMESDHFSQTAGEAAGSAPESVACPYTAVEVQAAGGLIEEVTDRLAVAELFYAVDSLFADADRDDQQTNGNFPAEEHDENHDLTESTNNLKGYTITFTAKDGSQAVYRLRGNMLVNVSTDETVFLSIAQVAELTAVLGISG